MVCLLNSERARAMLGALNPTANFQVGDINRLALFPMEDAATIMKTLRTSFDAHQRTREISPLFVQPGPSTFGEEMGFGEGAKEPETWVADWLSYAFGCAIGRKTPSPWGVGPLGVSDSLESPQAAPLLRAWQIYGATSSSTDLRAWLRYAFSRRTTSHGIGNDRFTYRYLPVRRALCCGFISRTCGAAGSRVWFKKWLVPAREEVSDPALMDELDAFIDGMTGLLRYGPPAAAPQDPPREVDSPFDQATRDGVRVTCGVVAGATPAVERALKVVVRGLPGRGSRGL